MLGEEEKRRNYNLGGNNMKTIWYAVVDSIEVPDDMSDDEIDNKINKIADGKEVMWSEKDDLIDIRQWN